ncbi:hypothetical protein [Nitrosopumilus sp.]|uniref:hypothetical protein n=1 Tax=Nitrosopumilus sp. TaxID=2024843 RepID=UPI002930EEA4|nr:hypothetical protein [Nitrosopumilus sp.]
MNLNDGLSGIEHLVENAGDIRITESGVYVVIAAPQIGRTLGETSSSSEAGDYSIMQADSVTKIEELLKNNPHVQ